MKKIISIWEKKAYFYISKISTVEFRKTPPQDDWCVYPAYIVTINNSDTQFLFNGTNFYLEVENKQEKIKEIDAHVIEAEKMKEEWKTEEEIKEYFTWKGTQFVDRVEYIIDTPDDFKGILEKAMKAIAE